MPRTPGQFERTLIIADKGSYVSYLEGCTAPKRDTAQLHAAVVEIICEEDAEVKYSTVQNWYPATPRARAGILNYVTKRADCRGDRSKVMWTQVETGLGHHLEVSRPASCAATTPRASSTPSPSPTTTSRPTPAPR
jgi:Fe-S cluster assembly protein SufB